MTNIRKIFSRAISLESADEERVLRQASDPKQRTVVTTGPLSQQFTDELNRTYAKTDPVTGEAQPENAPAIAQESQAQDVTVLQNLVTNLTRAAVAPENAEGNVSGGEVTVYGIKEAELTPERIVEITTEIAGREDPSELVVVVEPEVDTSNANTDTAPVAAVREVRPNEPAALRAALESICKKFGTKMYPSLEAFCSACEDEAEAAEANPESGAAAAPAPDVTGQEPEAGGAVPAEGAPNEGEPEAPQTA